MNLEFLVRIDLSDEEEVLLNLTQELPVWFDEYASAAKHPEPPAIKEYLVRNGFPWNRKFLSVFVGIQGLTRNEDAKLGGYGRRFKLKPDAILHDIELACCCDIQTGIENGCPASYFVNLHDSQYEERQRMLLKVAEQARQTSSSQYAEARIHRTLRRTDVIWPES